MTASPIPVMYFANTLVRGGGEEHILTLLRGLDRSQFRPHLVCMPAVAAKLAPDVPADVEVVPLRLRRPGHLGAGLRLARLLRERRIGILHSHQFYSSLFASPIGWLCRVPVIVETPHLREQWRQGWLKSRFLVDRIAGRFVDHYIAVSAANARYLAEVKRLPPEKIVVIHNGCDLRRFEPGRTVPSALRRRLGFAGGDPVLVVVGRLAPQKGHRVLLEALPGVRREFPSVRLVCVGEGHLLDQLERQAGELGLAAAVRFVGYQADVAEWLALADVTVLPSFYEGLPLVAIESLAAGTPVVATAVDGTTEVVLDGKTGLTVPPGDPGPLAEAICRLLRDPPLRARMAQAGRQWVREGFSQERQLQETQRFYLDAWEHRRRGRLRQPTPRVTEPGRGERPLAHRPT